MELNEFVLEKAGEDYIVTCGSETVAYIHFTKKGVSVNSVFTESSKQLKTTEEAVEWAKKMTTKFVKNIIKK